MVKFKQLLSLFFAFFKIGLFTFGGGYAMIAVIEKELVEKKKWIEHEEFLNIIGIAESTPGPIAINSATFIGYKIGKVFGSIFATIGVVLPSFIIIFAISFYIKQFLGLKYVTYAFMGIRACVAYLILSAGIKMFKSVKKDPLAVILFFITAICMVVLTLLSKNFSSIFYILGGGVVGILIYLLSLVKKKKLNKNSIDNDKENSKEKGER